jgi:hypothetical protein
MSDTILIIELSKKYKFVYIWDLVNKSKYRFFIVKNVLIFLGIEKLNAQLLK